MVDVTAKPLTRRLAVARCAVVTTVDAVAALGDARNGMDPVEAARVAGIQGAKQTSSLIPLCHSIRVDHVSVDVEVTSHRIEITAVTEIIERTGRGDGGPHRLRRCGPHPGLFVARPRSRRSPWRS